MLHSSENGRLMIPAWEQEASDFWYEGVLLGNGDLGVVVFGANDRITFSVGKNDFWDRRYYLKYYKLITFRRFMEMAKNEWPADPVTGDAIPQKSGFECYKPIPLGDFPNPKPVCKVMLWETDKTTESGGRQLRPIRHYLSLENAELTTTSSVFTVVTRVQKNENLIFIRLVGSGENTVVSLRRNPDSTNTGIDPPVHKVEDRIGFVIQDMPPEDTYPDGFRCAVAVSLIGDATPELLAGEISWRVEGDSTLVIAVVTARDNRDPETAAKALLLSALQWGDAALREEHLRLWQKFWDASWVKIDDRETERLWYIHNYLLASAARPGAIAPGLFGPWIVEDKSAWHGGYVMDYNFEQTFAAALSCNHPELLEPYLETIESMLTAARQFAREVYEAKGIAFPHEIFPIDMRGQGHASATYVCETPWAVQQFWEYYEYTMDEAFLKERGYPVIAECADFLASYATPKGNGKYAFEPTRSPEHHRLMRGLPFNRNGSPELAFARYIFKAAIRGAAIVGDNSPRASKWKKVLNGLPDYPRFRNQLGEVFVDCEATPPEMHFAPPVPFVANARPSKRPGNHGPWMTYNCPTSILQIWPTGQIDMDSPLDELLTAIRTWLTLKCEGSNDLIIRHVAAARLGILTLEQFKREITPRLMPNGSITCMMNPLFEGAALSTIYMYRANGIYLENCAYPLVINEMMLQSHNGVIKLFPSMDFYRRAEFHDLRARGGFFVSAAMDRGFVLWAEIKSTVNGTCRLRLPWPPYAVSIKDMGSEAPINATFDGNDILFETVKGALYRLEPKIKKVKTA